MNAWKFVLLAFLVAGAFAAFRPSCNSSACLPRDGAQCAMPLDSGLSKDKLAAIHGKIQVVDSFPDHKVQVVTSFPDLKVKIVDSFPDNPGEWQYVDSFPDFKIQFVEAFPDFKVQFVDSFPGVP